jgi:hypothetical protein
MMKRIRSLVGRLCRKAVRPISRPILQRLDVLFCRRMEPVQKEIEATRTSLEQSAERIIEHAHAHAAQVNQAISMLDTLLRRTAENDLVLDNLVREQARLRMAVERSKDQKNDESSLDYAIERQPSRK